MAKYFSTYIFLFIFLILISFPSIISARDTGFQTITAPEVKRMHDEGKAVMINVLSKIEFDYHHIIDSVNIPIHQIQSIDNLHPDKNKPLIFYCMGAV
jgi:rhodanese-related sulfurtransferase